jgi:hypothetical protein
MRRRPCGGGKTCRWRMAVAAQTQGRWVTSRAGELRLTGAVLEEVVGHWTRPEASYRRWGPLLGGSGGRGNNADSNSVVGMERAVGFGSGWQQAASATWRCGGGGGACAAARAAVLRSDALEQRGVAASDRGARTRGRSAGQTRASLWCGATAVPPRAANPGAARGGLATDRRPPHVSEFQISEKPENFLPHKKNRYKVRKNLGN